MILFWSPFSHSSEKKYCRKIKKLPNTAPLRGIPCGHDVYDVHPTGGRRRVFRQFAWLGVGSGKMVLSRSAHPRVTLTVGQLDAITLNLFHF